MHDEGVDVTELGMKECFRKSANNREAKALPQAHGSFIRADNEIELHGAKTAFPRTVQRVRAHRSGNTTASRRKRCHVTAVGYMRPATLLVRLQKISSKDFAVLFCDENLMLRR